MQLNAVFISPYTFIKRDTAYFEEKLISETPKTL